MPSMEQSNILPVSPDQHADQAIFRLMTENSPRGMLFALENRVIYCNTKACEILDIADKDLREMSIETLSEHMARAEDRTWFQMLAMRDPGVPPLHGCEVCIVDRAGNQRWLELSCRTLLYQGKPAFLAEFSDVSLRRMTEIALYNEIHRSTVINNMQNLLLSSTENQLRDLLELMMNTFMADRVWLLRAIDIDLVWMKVIETVASDAQQDSILKDVLFKVPSAFRQQLEDANGILNGVNPRIFETINLAVDEKTHILVALVQMRTDLPWLLVFTHNNLDVWTPTQCALLLDVCRQSSIILMRWKLQSELQKRSIELQTEHNLTSALFRFSPMPSAVYDPFHSVIIKANEQWINAVGYPTGAVSNVNTVFSSLLEDKARSEEHLGRLRLCWEEGTPYLEPIDWDVSTLHGQRVWRIYHVPVHFHGENDSLWLITVVDVTERSAAEKALAQRNEELRILSDFSINVVQSLTPETILTEALHQLLGVFHAQFGSIYLYEPDTGECRQMRSLGTPEQLHAFSELITANDLVRNRRDWEELQLHNQVKESGQVVGSWVSIPLRSADIHYGMATIGHEQPGFFDGMSHEMLSTIGRTIGIAVENSRLFEATLQGAMELSVLVDAIHTISSELDLKNTLFRLANTLGER